MNMRYSGRTFTDGSVEVTVMRNDGQAIAVLRVRNGRLIGPVTQCEVEVMTRGEDTESVQHREATGATTELWRIDTRQAFIPSEVF